jgi:quercetin dioxygenase-like cupin family protein
MLRHGAGDTMGHGSVNKTTATRESIMKRSHGSFITIHHGLILLLASALASPALAGEPAISVSPDSDSLEWGPCPAFFGERCHIAVLHGDPAQPDSDILFRLEGQQAFPAHHHTSAERMVLLSGALQVTYEGQEAVNLAVGDYAYGPPGHVHHGKCVSDEPCVLFIAFEQPVDAMQAGN